MRDRQQIELSPADYADAKRAERRRILEQLLDELHLARESGAEWYVDALDFLRSWRAPMVTQRGD